MDEVLAKYKAGQLSAIEALEVLSSQKSYLFHGTRLGNLTSLGPRQALNNNNKDLDGPPSVFATALPSVAIFMAVVVGRSGKTSYVGRRFIGDDDLTFYAAKAALETAAKPANFGWVYIFSSQDFKNYRGHEYISTEHVHPLAKVKVTLADMPQPIVELIG